MINPRKKLITGTVLMLLMTAVLMAIMIGYSLVFDLGYIHFALDDQTAADKYQGVVQTVRELNGRYEEAYNSYYSLIQVKADMAAKACYKAASEEGDACILKHTKGSVVKIENGIMTIPAGSRVGLKKYSDRITGERGTLIYDTPTMNGVRKDILVYSHIKGPYYYVEITNGQNAYIHVSQYVGVAEILNGLEYVDGMTAVLICPDHENSRFFFCYPSDVIYNGVAVAEGGDPEDSDNVWDLDQMSGTGILPTEELGLTMGARDLISDILSGISLIFEGEYQMGDIVSIDGYRGMVQEVGVRTTRLEGRGGNIKTIRNSDVKNVINHTKLNSWVPVTIKVDVNYPLGDVEEILAKTLPRIAESCKEIISGPYYKGVLSVELGFAVLSIIAECREKDFYLVERTLMRDVLVALREKNVPVR